MSLVINSRAYGALVTDVQALSYFTGDLAFYSRKAHNKREEKKSWEDKRVIRTEEGEDRGGSYSLGSERSVHHSPLPSKA